MHVSKLVQDQEGSELCRIEEGRIPVNMVSIEEDYLGRSRNLSSCGFWFQDCSDDPPLKQHTW
jgi:hypothetical protein